MVREFFATNLWHRMAPHQTAMVVPGLFADTNTSRSGSLASQDERALSKLRSYSNWIKDEPRLVGINAWRWNDENTSIHPMRAKYVDGAYSLPKTAQLLTQLAAERPRSPGDSASNLASYEDPFRLTACPKGEVNVTTAKVIVAGGAMCVPRCSPPYPTACPTELPAGFPSKPGHPPAAPVCVEGRCMLACRLPPTPSICGPTKCMAWPGITGNSSDGVCLWQYHRGDKPKPPPWEPPVFSVKVKLGPEVVRPKLSTGPEYQFPDAALAFLAEPQLEPAREGNDQGTLMFPSDGKTFRTTGPDLFHQEKPDPAGPVLGLGKNGSYDMNGNWMLAAFRIGGRNSQQLVGFTHCEIHQFKCPGPYAEWNAAAVVRSSDDGRSWSREGLAVGDLQPCKPAFGGHGYSSVLRQPASANARDADASIFWRGWGGCNGYASTDVTGAAGTWTRYLDGKFSEPGVGGKQSCLPVSERRSCAFADPRWRAHSHSVGCAGRGSARTSLLPSCTGTPTLSAT